MPQITRVARPVASERPGPGTRPRLRVLVLEDDFGDFDAVARALRKVESFDAEIVRARTIVEARQAAARMTFDVAFVDYHLGPDSGLLFLQENGGRIGGALTILLTGTSDGDVHRTALDAGAIVSLNKRDISPTLLEATIRSGRHTQDLELKVQALIAAIGGTAPTARSEPSAPMLSAALTEVIRRADAIATTLGPSAQAGDALDYDHTRQASADARVIASLARELLHSLSIVVVASEPGAAASRLS